VNVELPFRKACRHGRGQFDEIAAYQTGPEIDRNSLGVDVDVFRIDALGDEAGIGESLAGGNDGQLDVARL